MKRTLKFILGIAVLVVVFFVFLFAQRSGNLTNGSLKHWLSASHDQRVATVKIAVAGDGDIDLVVACVNKMASLPDSGEMDIATAITLCHTASLVKENI